MAREVVCVTTDDASIHNDCRCIETIGYQIIEDNTWTKTPAEVHESIEDGKEYYVEHNGSKTYLEPAERNGTKYVRTEPNDTSRDNLLQQPSC
ncbi:DUF3892 domain-containing protein [Natrinema ejinorense]|uniref:DUF3892 domain-containing protein n=1 Tax=Natrinema ejinorense TaxID=373386 RepID=UPI001472F6AF|nr:DUF3892 domain-containing protein [Natrinema ejinorense]